MNAIVKIPLGQIIQVPNMRVPDQGAQALPFLLDFTNSATLDGSLKSAFDSGLFDFAQSVWIDNSLNSNSLTITFPGAGPLGQKITVAANSQGYYPVSPQIGDGRFTVAGTVGQIVPVAFYNVPLSYFTWSANVSASAILTGTFTARNGVIAAAGVSQSLVAANSARKRLYVFNPGNATGQGIVNPESLFLMLSGAAAGINDGTSLELFPGGYFDTGAGPVPTNAITVNATTINHKYIAFEM